MQQRADAHLRTLPHAHAPAQAGSACLRSLTFCCQTLQTETRQHDRRLCGALSDPRSTAAAACFLCSSPTPLTSGLETASPRRLRSPTLRNCKCCVCVRPTETQAEPERTWPCTLLRHRGGGLTSRPCVAEDGNYILPGNSKILLF